MSLVYWYEDPDLGLTEITERCRLYQLRIGAKAIEGATWVGSLLIDDPDGDLEIVGHRVIAIEETEAEDPYDRFVFVGYTGKVRVRRGVLRTGAARQLEVELSDLNTILSRRVLVDRDNDRPAETDVARVEWVEETGELATVRDTRYLSTANPVNLDANDFTLQGALDVLSDASQASGKNFYLTYFGDVGYVLKPWGYVSLWYDFAHSTEYSSVGRITNVLADVDNDTTFAMGIEDDVLERDYMEIYERIVVPYEDTYVYAQRPETGLAYVARDAVMQAPNVRTKAKAQARANRYVEQARTPDDTATVKVTVPRHKVNLFREGMRVQVKVSHWYEPYPSEYTWMRCVGREVAEISEDDHATYEVTLELTRSVPAPPAPPVYGILRMTKGPSQVPASGTDVWFAFPGDDPGPGYPLEPTTGLISPILDGDPTFAGWPYSGWLIEGTGTVDVTFYTTTVGVIMNAPISHTVTFSILLNGVVVASTVETVTLASGFAAAGPSGLVTIEDLAVVPDDVISALVTCQPAMTGPLRWASGTGQNGERLEITGGSLS